MEFGAIATLARQSQSIPAWVRTPARAANTFDWWHRVRCEGDRLVALAERVADIAAVGLSLDDCFSAVYRRIGELETSGLRWRTDLGQTMWPPPAA